MKVERDQVLGVFAYVDDLVAAIGAVKEAGLKVHTVYSPVPSHEIQEAMGGKPSRVRFFTLLGGVLGVAGGISLACYAHLQWNLITGGKPILAWIPFVVVGFELTILLGVLFTVVSMLVMNRMPRLHLPDHYDPRFSEDRFGILVNCPDAREEEVRRLLMGAGAEEVHGVHG